MNRWPIGSFVWMLSDHPALPTPEWGLVGRLVGHGEREQFWIVCDAEGQECEVSAHKAGRARLRFARSRAIPAEWLATGESYREPIWPDELGKSWSDPLPDARQEGGAAMA